MTREFDERNLAKSRAVCERMAEGAASAKGLTERERRILEMWPRFEDGEPVMVGDHVDGMSTHVTSIEFFSSCTTMASDWGHLHLRFGEHVRRTDTVARDANGEAIHEGCTVYDVHGGRFTVTGIYDGLLGLRQDDVVIGSRMPADQFSISPRDSWDLLEMEAESIRKSIALHLGDYSPSCFTRSGDSIQDRVLALACHAKALAGAEVGR